MPSDLSRHSRTEPIMSPSSFQRKATDKVNVPRPWAKPHKYFLSSKIK